MIVLSLFYVILVTYSTKLGTVKLSTRKHILISIFCLVIICLTFSFVVGSLVDLFSNMTGYSF
jgi:hypothetical protein